MGLQVEPILGAEELQAFRAGFRGELLTPDDRGYDDARRVWNGNVDRYPGLIARCAGTADVVAAVDLARERALLVSVRGGGHNVAGSAVCDGGLVIDTSPMKGIHVDAERRRARAEAGVKWGELDHETQAFGLATTGGTVSDTGIAGLTLGGGFGWLARTYGYTVDNVLSFDVVTADGQLRTASPNVHPDLFWGLRGGGGNFGVVTSFEYQLHPVGPTVLGGMVLHPADRGRDVLRFCRDFVATAPDELGVIMGMLTAPPAPFVPEELQGTPVVAIVVCHSGSLDDAEAAVRPLREFGPPAVDVLGPMPYVAQQRLFDDAFPPGLQYYEGGGKMRDLSDGAIDAVLEYAGSTTSPLNSILVAPMGGAVARVDELATAYPNRDALYDYYVFAAWDQPEDSDRHFRW
ncbi:MAG: FAD-dependent oxidoreductase, partial [Candidatus Dormibacteraeota bacterium]|nr:FAD-dependent oxidoreductase [Candidatus Dormibacteraeota bacterium]MBO0761013.1 FAD-dependent oxidoreductase [Candidatus Dormibacteraeota bacterium]